MEKMLQQILSEISTLSKGQTQIIKRLDNIESDTSNIKGQLDENTQLIKALIHRTDELDAKYDSLLHTTATKDSIATLNAKLDILADRSFQQETKLKLIELK